jgi:hypothetical protein
MITRGLKPRLKKWCFTIQIMLNIGISEPKLTNGGFIFGHEENESALLEAKSQYLRATELRPLWPKFWTSLVKLKWRLQEFDEEMLYFFERVTVLGLQKPKVYLVVIELGLALYANNHLVLLNIRL